MAKKKTKSKRLKTNRKQSPPKTFWKNRQLLLPIAGVLIFTFLVFSNCLSHDFVNWDDPVNILENPYLQTFDWSSILGIFSSTVIGNYNPLSILSFAIEKAIFGLNPFVFHLNNILLHLIGVFLVYRIALKLNFSPIAAALVALLFGIHPMRVESVAWITERKDVLFGAFYLGAIYQYIRYLQSDRNNSKIFWTIIGLFTLSLFSKIQAVALPLSFLAIDYWFKRPLNWKLIVEKIPYFALSLLVGVLGIVLLTKEGSITDIQDYTLIDKLFIGGYSYFVYLVKFIYPYTMSPIYPYPSTIGWEFYIGTLISLLTVGGIFYAFKKDYRALVFSFAFFTFNVVFMLQILSAGQGFLADRFTYIPYLGLFIGVAYLFERGMAHPSIKSFLPFGMGIYLLGLTYMTWQQNKIWENGGTLWTYAINCDQDIPRAWANRADYYKKNNQFDLAIKDYEEAVKIEPDKFELYNSWGKLLFDKGQIPQAIEKYSIGIKQPNVEGEIYINRGAAYAAQKKFDQALVDINQGLSLDADNANGYLNRGLVYYSLNQLEKAIPDLSKYFTMKPGKAEEWFALALSYQYTNQLEASIPAFTKAIEINPSDKRYYKSRATVYQKLGKQSEANQDLEMIKSL